MSEDHMLHLILSKLQGIETNTFEIKDQLKNIDTRLEQVEARLDRVEARLDQVEARLDQVEVRLDQLEELIHKNYALVEEFYISQKEANTAIRSEIHIINGTLDMHTAQISLNTAALKEYKIS